MVAVAIFHPGESLVIDHPSIGGPHPVAAALEDI
jgi:hypothetical protein